MTMGQDHNGTFSPDDNLSTWLSMWSPSFQNSSHEGSLADRCFFYPEDVEEESTLLDNWATLIPASSLLEKNRQEWPGFTITSPLFAQQISPASPTESECTSVDSEMSGRNNRSLSSHSSPNVALDTQYARSFPPTSDDKNSENDTGLRMVQSGPESFKALASKPTRKGRSTQCRLQRRREQNRVSQKRYRNKKEALIVDAENHVQELERLLHSRLQQIDKEERRIAELNQEISMVRVKAFSCQQLAVLSLHN